MKFTITGKNVTVTEGLKDSVMQKLGKLEKYFTPDTEVNVTFVVEKDRQRVEVTIPVKGNIIRSEQESADMYTSIDMVEETIERQMRKYRGKIVEKHQSGTNLQKAFIENDYDDEEGAIKIVRNKKFDCKPMYPEDACVQMELLGHSFYVFFNAENEDVNVVYRRKDGAYGLIEPGYR